MTKRSTRKLIIDRTDCITRELDNCLFYLYEINNLAKGRSVHITSNTPILAEAVNELKNAVNGFREDL